MASKESIFEKLKPIADVVVQTFGCSCEVAIHNFSDLEHSLVYIVGAVTNRKPGAPITDLVVKAWQKEGNAVRNIYNYRTKTKQGRILKSSTAFIKNQTGKVIGAFCINFEISDFLNSITLFENFIRTVSLSDDEKSETFAFTVSETVESLIEESANEIGRRPQAMSPDERLRLVALLEYKGTFLIKGALDQVAATMGLSKYTVYHYLRKVRLAKRANDASSKHILSYAFNKKG